MRTRNARKGFFSVLFCFVLFCSRTCNMCFSFRGLKMLIFRKYGCCWILLRLRGTGQNHCSRGVFLKVKPVDEVLLKIMFCTWINLSDPQVGYLYTLWLWFQPCYLSPVAALCWRKRYFFCKKMPKCYNLVSMVVAC